ncbi:ABC transporter substrate-binding protein [Haloparvum alkalitolerans]|uniref:ABC transporter substrate-binding protein n=1 Tax=Haloparvum alkalitolerans TaxID=1042953 RepID=UPI003CE9164C
MPTNSNDEIGRRGYLKFAGAAAASVGLAGCAGDGADIDTPTETEMGGGDEDTETETEDTSDEPFEATVTQGQMATTLDPHNHRETSTDNVLLQAYDRVLFRDAEGRIVERLATDWERVEDGHVRYTLREGVTFHNGDELTPEDVAYSIRRVVDPETGLESPQRDQLAGIVDAEADEEEHAVHVYSDGLNPMVFSLQASYCLILQQSWAEERSQGEIAQNINGTGPYRLVNYEEDVSVEYERYEDWWGEAPDVDAVTFQAAEESSARVSELQAGETDLIVNVPPQDAPTIQDGDAGSIEAVPSTRVLFLVHNQAKAPFDSAAFRQAMNYAIDLESIIENVLDGFGDPTGQPTLSGYVGHADDVDPYPTDAAEAEALIEESGYAGEEITLHTPVGRYLGDVNVAQAAAGYIDDLSNVSCSVEQRDFGSLASEILDGSRDTSPAFFLIGWGNTTFDASQTILPWLTSGGSISHWDQSNVDGWMEDAGNESDEEARAELMADSNRTVSEEAAWTFLHRQYSVYGISNRIEWNAREDEQISVEEFTRA